MTRGCSTPRRGSRSTRCIGTMPPTLRPSCAKRARRRSRITSGRSRICTHRLSARVAGPRSALPTSRNRPRTGRSGPWGRSVESPVGGWYGLRKGYRGRFAVYLPPLLEELGLAELTHEPRNNRMRARNQPGVRVSTARAAWPSCAGRSAPASAAPRRPEAERRPDRVDRHLPDRAHPVRADDHGEPVAVQVGLMLARFRIRDPRQPTLARRPYGRLATGVDAGARVVACSGW